jgi:hypothetical protein
VSDLSEQDNYCVVNGRNAQLRVFMYLKALAWHLIQQIGLIHLDPNFVIQNSKTAISQLPDYQEIKIKSAV